MSCPDCAVDIRTQDGLWRCDECIALTHTQCSGCDQWYPASDSCDEPSPSDDVVTTANDDDICQRCRRRSYWQCDSCDAWNHDDDSRCGNGCSDASELIHDYYYKPYPEFHGSGPLFLGVEIEIHTPYGVGDDVCADIATSHLGELGYLKEDESIGGGFEVVSHPMSYDWALTNFPWTMLPDLRKAGCSTSSSTGLHVHVSRAGFDSACHVFKWMKFIYRNRGRVTRLARRSSTQWAAFTDEDRRAVKHFAKGVQGERYRAINTGNDDTFELRVFASSLDIGDVQAALALASASIEYTRQLSLPQIFAGGWDWPEFADWVNSRPQYAPLREQMEVLACAC
jgi:hypothetical protein